MFGITLEGGNCVSITASLRIYEPSIFSVENPPGECPRPVTHGRKFSFSFNYVTITFYYYCYYYNYNVPPPIRWLREEKEQE